MKPLSTVPKSASATPSAPDAPRWGWESFAWALGALLLVLGGLFSRSFQESQILFSSDGPLGANSAAYAAMPGAYTGMWNDLYWVGGRSGSAFPSVTYLLLWGLKPLYFAKFYAPLCLLALGLSAWLCFRQLGFRPGVCVLGGLAAALNTGFLSYACWGLGTLPLTMASVFLAVAAVVTPGGGRAWVRLALAGLAVGMAVMEGFDTGAIMSLYVAAFVIFQAAGGAGSLVGRCARGVVRVLVVATMAAFIAAQALNVLIGTQLVGVVGMEQDTRTKTQRWDEATMWSLPKLETLRVVIPGLFGYRMDTPNGGYYWGAVGQRPGVIQSRHSGAGVYGGTLVAVVAFWALLQSFRRKDGPFDPAERRAIRFWTGALLISLLLAWGRHAPFYQFFYALPYFSAIRNPIKFMHPFSLCLVILFGYGLQALWRQYLEPGGARGGPARPAGAGPGAKVAWVDPDAGGFMARLKQWWGAAARFDRLFATGLAVALGGSLVGWMVYWSSRSELEAYLKKAMNPELAPAIASFSLQEVGWFVLFLALAAVVLTLIFSGILGGGKARWGAACLGLLLVADFVRANVPWVYYWNYEEKYAANPIIDLLRQRPYEQRVAMLPFGGNDALSAFQQFYHMEWLQHHFPYYNIQSIDVPQEPRAATENVVYRGHFFGLRGPGFMRMLELTGTRYVLGMAGGFIDAVNQQLDPAQKRLRPHTAFAVEPTRLGGPVLIRTNAEGPFALLEFSGALPRAALYPHWQVVTNEPAALNLLAEAGFDPRRTMLVDRPLGAAPPSAGTNALAVAAEFVHYSPRLIRLKAVAPVPSVLLLNDKFDPHWTATVDGQPQPIGRGNYLMRAVHVPAGSHTVEFRFGVSLVPLRISLAAIGVGALLLLVLAIPARRFGAEAG